MDKTEKIPPSGSQSKLSPILFWVVVAAVVFRLVTTVTDKDKKEAGAGLVKWEPPEKAQALAARTGRHVLYDFTAAWCSPCHRLDQEAWGDDAIAEKVNGGFVAVRVVDREREDGKNSPAVSDLETRYRIQAFPTLIVADTDGREIARHEGFANRDGIAKFLDESRVARPAAAAGN